MTSGFKSLLQPKACTVTKLRGTVSRAAVGLAAAAAAALAAVTVTVMVTAPYYLGRGRTVINRATVPVTSGTTEYCGRTVRGRWAAIAGQRQI